MTPHPYNVTILFLDYEVIIFDDVNPLGYCDVTVSLCPWRRTGVFLLLCANSFNVFRSAGSRFLFWQTVEMQPFNVIQVKVEPAVAFHINIVQNKVHLPRSFFSALVGSQLCERSIQWVISCGAQPFPKQNSIQFECFLVANGFCLEHSLIFFWPRL